tara:strand:+ start:73 stop:288 length:216 start_codon:yes stop_codon:yes gene_type:complete
MAKLNIDGVDVYSDDFDEDQTKVFQEVQQVAAELARLEFLTHCLKQRQGALAPLLLPKEEKKEETKKDNKK